MRGGDHKKTHFAQVPMLSKSKHIKQVDPSSFGLENMASVQQILYVYILSNQMFKQLFRKWPEVISENGFLSAWSRKPYKIVQIKSFRFKNTPETAQAIRLCANLKSHYVSEGFHFAETVCAILSLHW